MKKIMLVLIALALIPSVMNSQRLIVGEKMPEFKVKEWAGNKPAEGRPRVIQFINVGSVNVKVLEGLALSLKDTQADLILVSREPKDKIVAALNPFAHHFYVAIDEGGKIFESFNVQFVPYSVIVDGKGKVNWFGNDSQLEDKVSSYSSK